jgi:hypothetical protein
MQFEENPLDFNNNELTLAMHRNTPTKNNDDNNTIFNTPTNNNNNATNYTSIHHHHHNNFGPGYSDTIYRRLSQLEQYTDVPNFAGQYQPHYNNNNNNNTGAYGNVNYANPQALLNYQQSLLPNGNYGALTEAARDHHQHNNNDDNELGEYNDDDNEARLCPNDGHRLRLLSSQTYSYHCDVCQRVSVVCSSLMIILMIKPRFISLKWRCTNAKHQVYRCGQCQRAVCNACLQNETEVDKETT